MKISKQAILAAIFGVGLCYAQEQPLSKTVVTAAVPVPATGITLLAVNGSSVTIGDVVGTQIGSWTGGNFNATGADQFRFIDASGAQKTAYFEISSGNEGLKDISATFGASVAGTVLKPNTHVIVIRAAAASATSVTLFSCDAEVGEETTISIDTGFNFLAWPRAQAVTLNESGLSAVLTAGNFTPTGADILRIDTDGDGNLELYYFESGASPSGWKSVSNTYGSDLGDTITINPFQGFIIERLGANTQLVVQ